MSSNSSYSPLTPVPRRATRADAAAVFEGAQHGVLHEVRRGFGPDRTVVDLQLAIGRAHDDARGIDQFRWRAGAGSAGPSPPAATRHRAAPSLRAHRATAAPSFPRWRSRRAMASTAVATTRRMRVIIRARTPSVAGGRARSPPGWRRGGWRRGAGRAPGRAIRTSPARAAAGRWRAAHGCRRSRRWR